MDHTSGVTGDCHAGICGSLGLSPGHPARRELATISSLVSGDVSRRARASSPVWRRPCMTPGTTRAGLPPCPRIRPSCGIWGHQRTSTRKVGWASRRWRREHRGEGIPRRARLHPALACRIEGQRRRGAPHRHLRRPGRQQVDRSPDPLVNQEICPRRPPLPHHSDPGRLARHHRSRPPPRRPRQALDAINLANSGPDCKPS
jgi:hypothetical protein